MPSKTQTTATIEPHVVAVHSMTVVEVSSGERYFFTQVEGLNMDASWWVDADGNLVALGFATDEFVASVKAQNREIRAASARRDMDMGVSY